MKTCRPPYVLRIYFFILHGVFFLVCTEEDRLLALFMTNLETTGEGDLSNAVKEPPEHKNIYDTDVSISQGQ